MANVFFSSLSRSLNLSSFYDDPENEEKNMASTDDMVMDHLSDEELSKMLFYITWSKNRNAVVYQFVEGVDLVDSVRTFWVEDKGDDAHRSELNEQEERYFGIDFHAPEPGSSDASAMFTVRALQRRIEFPVRLISDSEGTVAAIVASPENPTASLRLDRAYVQFRDTSPIEVDSVKVYGTNTMTGAEETFVLRNQ